MAKYEVTHKCGHVEWYDLIGPHRIREWRLKQLAEELCYACRQEELRQQNLRAAEENRQMELPPLEGTEKQILWAETIRNRKIKAVDALISSTEEEPPAELPQAMEWLYGQTSAGWWIDRRHLEPSALVQEAIKAVRKQAAQPQVAKEVEMAALAEATVRPENPKTETVAEIRILGGNIIEVRFPERRESFRELMKLTLGYRWENGVWRRQIGPFNGPVEDRVAEVGYRLLAAGFPIRIHDVELRRRAVAGEFAPEPKRWVRRATSGPYAGWFQLTWPKRTDDFYAQAKRIPGSRWYQGAMYVPAEQFEQVLDFAEVHGFQVSDGARQLAEEARQIRENALVAKLPEKAEPPARPGSVPPKLEAPAEVTIDDELRDDD